MHVVVVDPAQRGIGISFRLSEDGSLRRVPRCVAQVMPLGENAIPELAGTRQRAAYDVVEAEDSRVVRILNARGEF